MKFITFFIIYVLMGCQTTTQDGLVEALRSRLDQMESAYESNQNQAIADIYSNESYLIGPNGIIAQGRKAVDDYWAGGNAKQIRWQLEDFGTYTTLEDLLNSEVYKNLTRKPPLWDDLDINLDANTTYAYQLGRSTLVNENNQDRGGSIVNFLLVWEKIGEAYYIYIDSYIGSN